MTKSGNRSLAMWRWFIETLGALWQLMILLVRVRGRISGPFLRWRSETAFGTQHSLSLSARLGAILEYGRWLHRMKTGRW